MGTNTSSTVQIQLKIYELNPKERERERFTGGGVFVTIAPFGAKRDIIILFDSFFMTNLVLPFLPLLLLRLRQPQRMQRRLLLVVLVLGMACGGQQRVN